MTNLEYAVKYYPNAIINLLKQSENIAVDISSDDGKYKICGCSDISCNDCKFNRPDKSCGDLADEWLRDEYDGSIDTSDTSDNNEGGISW